MTIKGLEPELKRMMDTHQKEKKALEYKFQQSLEIKSIEIEKNWEQKVIFLIQMKVFRN